LLPIKNTTTTRYSQASKQTSKQASKQTNDNKVNNIVLHYYYNDHFPSSLPPSSIFFTISVAADGATIPDAGVVGEFLVVNVVDVVVVLFRAKVSNARNTPG